MSKPNDHPFLCDPTTSTSHVSGSGDQSDIASEVPINDAGDTTIGDTTPHAAEHATHHLNRSTPAPANTVRSTQPSSTPFSKNVSGNAPSDRHKDPLYSLLENNTKNPTIIVFKNFLDPETLEHLAKFNISLKKSEVEHYQPFTILVNHILAAGACQKVQSLPSSLTLTTHSTCTVHLAPFGDLI
ncbi:hypothetical protein BS47DRAFT_268723 [Hydnum rufescens UP504]|uniref:Uncharacterized protein n=1 Tax=Hydnum rufescens UP504 TaxID=1448309 RepID=A0A9P6DQZ4_9AGAM|nr:hypothetical protein BS47DRAFT_268723 [Hydnum rufescens UP504]